MNVPSSNRVRVVANYARLVSTFALGLILVRLLLGIGEEAYGLIALLGAGTGIASAIKEVVRASMVPELSAAYHDGSERFQETYNASLWISPIAGLLTLVGFGVLAASISWLQVPPDLVWAAQLFVIAKALQTFVTICLAPTFNMYLVTERMVTYNVWIVVERLCEVASAAVVLLFLTGRSVSQQIVAYGTASSLLSVVALLVSVVFLIRKQPELRPQLKLASRKAARSVLHSVGWNGAVVTAMNLYTRMDMLIMNLMFGLFGNLVFGLASQLTFYVRQLTMGVVAGVDAVAARLTSDQKGSAVQHLMRQSIRLQAIVVLPAAVVLLLYAETLISLWVGSRITDADATIPTVSALVRILIVGIAARSLSETWMRVLAGAGEVRLYASTVLAAAVTNPFLAFAAIYVLAPSHKILAPAIVFSCLLFVVHLVYLPFVVAKHYDVSLTTIVSPLVRPFFAAAAALAIVLLVSQLGAVEARSFASLFVFVFVYALACFAIVIESRERAAFAKLFGSLTLFAGPQESPTPNRSNA